jgi:hypothetical protein
MAWGPRSPLVESGTDRKWGRMVESESVGERRVHLGIDEQIPGDSDSGARVVEGSAENFDCRYRLEAKRYDFGTILRRVFDLQGPVVEPRSEDLT